MRLSDSNSCHKHNQPRLKCLCCYYYREVQVPTDFNNSLWARQRSHYHLNVDLHVLITERRTQNADPPCIGQHLRVDQQPLGPVMNQLIT